MIIGIPREIMRHEYRVSALPDMVPDYVEMGFDVVVESGAGAGVFRSDEEYERAGALIVEGPQALFDQADIVLKVKQPLPNEKTGLNEAEMLREGSVLITFLHPAAPGSHRVVKLLQAGNVTSFTMDSIPRTPRAQKMDALTSMSTVSGYKSVLMAAERFPRFVPIMCTAGRTIQPANVLVIGTGVVGLQAIATARRLGGRVKVVDIRDEARKEAGSLKAEVVGFEVPDELAIGTGGYAMALSDDWLAKERQHIRADVEEADIIILSALVPGEMAPVLITEDMVRQMRAGSVIVDVSIDQGGNCAVAEAGKEVVKYDVCICGSENIPGSVAMDSSRLYATNMVEYVKNLFKQGTDVMDLDDDIVQQSIVTHQGRILHKGTLKSMRQVRAMTATTARVCADG